MPAIQQKSLQRRLMQHHTTCDKGARWPSGRASDSESNGPGFEPHKGHRVVFLSNAHLLPRVLVNAQEAMAPSRHD